MNGIRKMNTVEPLIAATFTAKVRWPLLGGGRYSEVYYNFFLNLMQNAFDAILSCSEDP